MKQLEEKQKLSLEIVDLTGSVGTIKVLIDEENAGDSMFEIILSADDVPMIEMSQYLRGDDGKFIKKFSSDGNFDGLEKETKVFLVSGKMDLVLGKEITDEDLH